MNRPRDSRGRYIRNSPRHTPKFPPNFYGGRTISGTSSATRYQRTPQGASSSREAREAPSGASPTETIEKPEEPKSRTTVPLDPSSHPRVRPEPEINPTSPFAFPTSSEPPATTIFRDPNFVDLVDPEQVNTLFGSPSGKAVSKEEPTADPEGYIADNFSRGEDIPPRGERWDASLSPRREHWYTRFDPKDFVYDDQGNPLEEPEGPYIENPYSLFGNNKKQDPCLETAVNMDGHRRRENEEINHNREEARNNTEATFGFPILDTAMNVTMKSIPAASLPSFYGKTSEDPDTFLFEFDILCRSYNYLQDAQKLKLFPATLKDSALRWFMALGESSIRTWNDMKTVFLQKYQDYCRPKDSKNDIFRVRQQEDESLEDYLERFTYILHKSKYEKLEPDAVRTLFLQGIQEELLETLNLMASGDVSQKSLEDICEMCWNYSRSRTKTSRSIRDPYNRNLKGSPPGGVTRTEIGNLLENFKTDILGTLGSQLDTFKAKKRQEEENAAFSIFCPKCRRKHPARE
jgi:hypothetical protein